MSTTSTLFKLARLSASMRAVSRGRGGARLVNIAIGRVAGRLLSGLWR